jgi:uncharacterized LabA/DUF88 family protein
MQAVSPRRVSLYVDGFNFYYATRAFAKRREAELGHSVSGLCWCNFRALIERSGWLNPDETLTRIRYYTAPVPASLDNPQRAGEPDRQRLWLEALQTVPGVEIVEGFYRPGGKHGIHREEKQTDVNLALDLLLDAIHQAYDRAILLSGDADEIPALLAATHRIRHPRDVTALLPIGAHRGDYIHRLQETRGRLRRLNLIEADAPGKVAVVEVCEQTLANALLPYDETRCPQYWRLPCSYLDRHCSPVNRPDRPALAAGSR